MPVVLKEERLPMGGLTVMVYPNCVEGNCGITVGSPFLAGKTPEEILERMQRR
jgi:hypothetical protein